MRNKMQGKDKRIVVWRLCCHGSFRARSRYEGRKKNKLLKRIVCDEVLITAERNRIA